MALFCQCVIFLCFILSLEMKIWKLTQVNFFYWEKLYLLCKKVILNCRNAKHWKYQCFHVVFIKCLTNPLNNEYRFVALCELSLDIDHLCQYICFYKWNTFDHCNPMRTCQLEMYSGVPNRFASLNILYIEQFFSFCIVLYACKCDKHLN